MDRGAQVVAAVRIEESGYRGEDLFTHAEVGDLGEVLEALDGGWLMVRWPRRSSVAQCHLEEITSASGVRGILK